MADNHYDFEEEIMTFEPHLHHIYETLGDEDQKIYPRPKEHLDQAAKEREKRAKYEETLNSSDQAKLKAIIAVQEIAKTKPIGEQPTLADWDTNENIEKEMIGMMQYCGLTCDTNDTRAFVDPSCTRQMVGCNKNGIIVSQNGSKTIPILLDDRYFKLRPRNHPANNNDMVEPKDLIQKFNNNNNITVEDENQELSSNRDKKPKVSLALKNAIAAAQQPSKKSQKFNTSGSCESNSTLESLLDFTSSSCCSSKAASGSPISYANMIKKNNTNVSTEQTNNNLDIKDARNKYLTPRELYLLKKNKN